MVVQLLMLLVFLVDVSKNVRSTESPRMNWDFNQTDYDLKLERMSVNRYSNVYFRSFEAAFVPYNRSQRVINASFELLRDILRGSAKLEVQVYKFRSNEYRFFPITLTVNPCVEYEHNSFHAQEMFTKKSNFRGCPMKKGFYKIGNALPEFSKFPPLMPRGQYKVNINFSHNKEFLVDLDAYASVNDKPMKWQQ